MTVVKPAQTYRNGMEPLVIQEVTKQLKQLPSKTVLYINQAEAIAYALNRLPPLYATSEKGWQQQQVRASRDLHTQLVAAVRQALVAVQRDPLRSVAPLKLEEDRDAGEALQGLKELLRANDLSWKNVVDQVEHALIRTARGEITWRKRGSAVAEGHEWGDNRYML